MYRFLRKEFPLAVKYIGNRIHLDGTNIFLKTFPFAKRITAPRVFDSYILVLDTSRNRIFEADEDEIEILYDEN